jgi:hypothetical protein
MLEKIRTGTQSVENDIKIGFRKLFFESGLDISGLEWNKMVDTCTNGVHRLVTNSSVIRLLSVSHAWMGIMTLGSKRETYKGILNTILEPVTRM